MTFKEKNAISLYSKTNKPEFSNKADGNQFCTQLRSLIFQEEELSRAFLFRILDRVILIDARPEVVGISSESNAQQLKESIHAIEQRLGRVRSGLHRGLTLNNNDTIRQVCRHNEIVLHYKASLLGMQNVTVN